MSGDPEQDYFGDAMTEEIITRLSMSNALTVIARNSTFYYKNKQIKVQQLGEELGARYVVEGSIRIADDTIRVTAQLIDAASEGHIWADTYDRRYRDIFSIQDEIAQRIVSTLNIKSWAAEASRIKRSPPKSLGAYDYVLKGEVHLYDEGNLGEARESFTKAVELDPEYVRAHVGLASVYYSEDFDMYDGTHPRIDHALDTAHAALELDPSDASVHSLLAAIYLRKGQIENALVQANESLELNPNQAELYYLMGEISRIMGKTEDAIDRYQKAMHLHPRWPPIYMHHWGHSQMNLGRYEKAEKAAKQVIARYPAFKESCNLLSAVYAQQWTTQQTEDHETLNRSLESINRCGALEEGGFWVRVILGQTYRLRKQYDLALAEAEKMIARYPKDPWGHLYQAAVYNLTGNAERATDIIREFMPSSPEYKSQWYIHLGDSYRMSGRLEEAIATYRMALDHNADFVSAYRAHLNLSIVYSRMGQIEQAKAEAAEVLKLVPNFSVNVYGERIPYKDPAMAERDMAALRKAGLK